MRLLETDVKTLLQKNDNNRTKRKSEGHSNNIIYMDNSYTDREENKDKRDNNNTYMKPHCIYKVI